MTIAGKIAVLVGFMALVSSCQKEDMPSPSGCPSHQEDGANMRISDPNDEAGTTGGSLKNDGPTVAADSIEIVGGGDGDRDGGDDIVGGGDGDRDGGGVVGGGDEGHDGGRMQNPGEKPK